MSGYSSDYQRPISPPSSNQDVTNVEAEGLDYIRCRNFDCEGERSIIPSLLNYPDGDASVDSLSQRLGYILPIPVPKHAESFSKGMPRRTSFVRRREGSLPTALRSLITRSLPPTFPSSPNSDSLRASYSEDEANRNVPWRQRRNKKAIIRKMRHRYNEHHLPGPSRLAQCSCNSCWAENLLAISRGAVTPTFAERYSPSRTGDKCERIRSIARIKFSERQKTLTFDVWSGKVFAYGYEQAALSCEKKDLGDGWKDAYKASNGGEDSGGSIGEADGFEDEEYDFSDDDEGSEKEESDEETEDEEYEGEGLDQDRE